MVDALDEQAVESFVSSVAQQAGSIDISFNAIGLEDEQGLPLIEMTQQSFALPINIALISHFYTANAATRHMAPNRSGVIMAITANAARTAQANMGGFGVACAAIEGFCRQLAAEVGPHGIRVVCLRSSGSPDAPGVSEVLRPARRKRRYITPGVRGQIRCEHFVKAAAVAGRGSKRGRADGLRSCQPNHRCSCQRNLWRDRGLGNRARNRRKTVTSSYKNVLEIGSTSGIYSWLEIALARHMVSIKVLSRMLYSPCRENRHEQTRQGVIASPRSKHVSGLYPLRSPGQQVCWKSQQGSRQTGN